MIPLLKYLQNSNSIFQICMLTKHLNLFSHLRILLFAPSPLSADRKAGKL
ncbi:hypothetical protein AM1_0076 [Acaryochloris marina MBIC11017]|uniref:Uncharacterized protein n=1 Tax=Acaryochloris marina (strain MBIC 11017) TaxID=329726 RepID=B0C552_ACAM1|nr:hypothetical protein AM1_0076 [Acaryochloris marina MBIC11017]